MDPPTYPFEETSFMNGPLLSYKIKENASVERAIFNSARFGNEIFINRIHEGGHQISVKLCTNKERRKVYLYL